MADHEDHDVAQRAYTLWEAAGRPEGRDLEFWLKAEAEANARAGIAPPPTNLERALPAAARTQVRAARHGSKPPPNSAVPANHYMAVVDRAHLRIYQVREPQWSGSTQFELAEAFDLIAGHQQYTDRDSDLAGRFPGGSGRAMASGAGTNDERLPMKNEHERRVVGDIVDALTRFFAAQPGARWDFAAGPGLHQAILDRLPKAIRARVGIALVKELIHQTPAQLRAHLDL